MKSGPESCCIARKHIRPALCCQVMIEFDWLPDCAAAGRQACGAMTLAGF